MAICIKLFGEEHELYKTALQSVNRSLAICIKMIGEEHELTANSYRTLVILEQA